jgi:Bacterial extracellular solute-binding proteins, family 5 Middle
MDGRTFLAGGTALATIATTAPWVHAQKKGGTLRFVPHADLKILDPIWTTAYVTHNHGHLIYDTLFATDADLKVQPRMIDKYTVSPNKMRWTFTLRNGLKFRDGWPVTAKDCVASVKRWGARDTVGRLLMAATGRLAPVERKTLALDLDQPLGLVPEGIGKWQKHRRLPSWKHAVPTAFVARLVRSVVLAALHRRPAALLTVAAPYAARNGLESARAATASGHRDPSARASPVRVALAVAVMHLAYGTGSWRELVAREGPR